MKNVKTRLASGVRFGLMVLIAAVAGCSGPRVVESHSYRSGAKPMPRAGATYYLPRQLIAVQLDRKSTSEGSMQDVLTVWLRPPTADTRMRFYVRMPRDGQYTLQTTEDGLLTSANAPAANPRGRELGKYPVTTAAVSKACGPLDGLLSASPVTAHALTTMVVFDPTVVDEIARAEE